MKTRGLLRAVNRIQVLVDLYLEHDSLADRTSDQPAFPSTRGGAFSLGSLWARAGLTFRAGSQTAARVWSIGWRDACFPAAVFTSRAGATAAATVSTTASTSAAAVTPDARCGRLGYRWWSGGRVRASIRVCRSGGCGSSSSGTIALTSATIATIAATCGGHPRIDFVPLATGALHRTQARQLGPSRLGLRNLDKGATTLLLVPPPPRVRLARRTVHAALDQAEMRGSSPAWPRALPDVLPVRVHLVVERVEHPDGIPAMLVDRLC